MSVPSVAASSTSFCTFSTVASKGRFWQFGTIPAPHCGRSCRPAAGPTSGDNQRHTAEANAWATLATLQDTQHEQEQLEWRRRRRWRHWGLGWCSLGAIRLDGRRWQACQHGAKACCSQDAAGRQRKEHWPAQGQTAPASRWAGEAGSAGKAICQQAGCKAATVRRTPQRLSNKDYQRGGSGGSHHQQGRVAGEWKQDTIPQPTGRRAAQPTA